LKIDFGKVGLGNGTRHRHVCEPQHVAGAAKLRALLGVEALACVCAAAHRWRRKKRTQCPQPLARLWTKNATYEGVNTRHLATAVC
jgi:hypothetical protein